MKRGKAMKEVIQHPVYGEIIYNESIWSGKKTLTVNGICAQKVSKKEFLIDGKKALVNGNELTGVHLYIDGETVELLPKPKWYEVVLAILPFMFLMVWGNNVALCSIFPVVGGAIGGGLGGLALVLSLLFMKKSKSVASKLAVGISTFIITIVVAYILAIALILIMA